MKSARQLIVISGKGGTGKTSIVAAFAALAEGAVLADCDVDAANLHLVLDPQPGEPHDFSGRRRARIDAESCRACGRCADVCRFDAVQIDDAGRYVIDPLLCEGCGLCERVCPWTAIATEPVVNGAWLVSETRFGPLVHARLGVAEDNSGKLVTVVRTQAQEVARRRLLPLVIVDGAPGIGCPVIASLTGADLVLAVTEPTVSGRHDLERVLQVVRRFRLRYGVCVNKADLNPDLADQMTAEVSGEGALFVARVRYDSSVTRAQVAGVDPVTFGGSAAGEIAALWDSVREELLSLPGERVAGG